MELLCEKYKEKVDSENARCAHPVEYCRFRTSCIIHFMEKERDFENKKKTQDIKKNDNVEF